MCENKEKYGSICNPIQSWWLSQDIAEALLYQKLAHKVPDLDPMILSFTLVVIEEIEKIKNSKQRKRIQLKVR